MDDPIKKQRTYKILAIVFAVAGFSWIIGGIYSGRYFIYPFFGLINWAVAYYCRLMSQGGLT